MVLDLLEYINCLEILYFFGIKFRFRMGCYLGMNIYV